MFFGPRARPIGRKCAGNSPLATEDAISLLNMGSLAHMHIATKNL